MEFTIRFSEEGKYVWVTAGKELVFDAGDVEQVQLERTSSSFKLSVTNRAGDRKVFSPRGVEVIRAGESRLERVGRLLERLERDHPSLPRKDGGSSAGDEGVGEAVARDINDFIAGLKGQDDEQDCG